MDYDQHILSAIADGKIYVNFSAENNQYRVITKERMLIFGSQGVEISHRFDDPTQLETSTLAALTTVREDHNILTNLKRHIWFNQKIFGYCINIP